MNNNDRSFRLKGAAVVGLSAMLGFFLFGVIGAVIGVLIAAALVK